MPQGAVHFKLNGTDIDALAGETILQAARRHAVEIPHLCYSDGLRPDGNCRACMVEIDGERVLAPSCCRVPSEGMQVRSDSERARHSQRLVLELLQSDMPGSSHTRHNELDYWSQKLQLGRPRFARRTNPAARSRSTASSDMPAGARRATSSSISTTRWARVPASPAASVYRPALPAP
jgi:formate dehydrogenase major subunit